MIGAARIAAPVAALTLLLSGLALPFSAAAAPEPSSDQRSIPSSAPVDESVAGITYEGDPDAEALLSEISRTSSHNNAADGVKLTRGTSGIVLDRVTSKRNGANGISLNGRPLADGPSATGTPVGAYGNNQVTNSTSKDNARYGIDVLGGSGVQVDSNAVEGNAMGIVVGAGATEVVIKNNMVEDSAKQGIALRTAGTDAVVSGNTVIGGEIGIYARDAGGTFERNTVEDVTNHAITLIGTTGTSTIHRNTVTGKGPSAIDVARTEGAVVTDNDAEEWRSTKGALRAGLAIRLATRRVHLRIDDRCCPVMPPH